MLQMSRMESRCNMPIITSLFLVAILSMFNTSVTLAGKYYAPGKASWLGSSGVSSTPKDYKSYFPIIYVVLGVNGTPHLRAIVDIDDDCPSPLHEEDVGENVREVQLDTRVLGNPINDNKMPYKFPVRVCELKVENHTIHRTVLEEGKLKISWKEKSYLVPRVKSNPTRFMLTADTGLRIKPTNLGLGNLATGAPPCNSTTVYGIHQCLLNFTKEGLTQLQTGSFQGLDEWHFKELLDSAISKDIDVIIHLGDYLYRQGPCPLNNTDFLDQETKNCSAVNVPEFASAADIVVDTVMNFIPGEYGDNWWGWWSDFFYPTLNLLKEAPIIALRGNHEICDRGGYGYFMFLSPVQIEDYCLENFTPYAIKFDHEQFLVMDDSIIKELNGGVDHFLPGTCQGEPGIEFIVPLQQTRYNDTNDKDIQNHLDLFSQHFKMIDVMSLASDNNFYIGHHPIFGIGCNNGTVVTLDWTLQQSLGPTTLDRISAIFSGHVHWLQVIEFENNTLPPNIIVGNGGTKMIRNNINQSSFPQIDLEIDTHDFKIEGKVRKGFTSSQFGYGIMERNKDGNYEVTFHMWHDSNSTVRPLDYSVLIRKGPRKCPDTYPSSENIQISTQKSTWFLLISVLLMAGAWFTTTKFSLPGWIAMSQVRRTYEPIYEMEPLHSQ